MIGAVTLRAEYLVYHDPSSDGYLVDGSVRHDHAEPVTATAVETARHMLERGFESVVEIANEVRLLGPSACGFNHAGDHRLLYEVQWALIVLVAQGIATATPASRGFVFALRVAH